MRILAHMCGEGVLVDAFNAGEDVHLRTAQDIAEEGTRGHSRNANHCKGD